MILYQFSFNYHANILGLVHFCVSPSPDSYQYHTPSYNMKNWCVMSHIGLLFTMLPEVFDLLALYVCLLFGIGLCSFACVAVLRHNFVFSLQTFTENLSRAGNMQRSVLSSDQSEMTVINSEFIDCSQRDDSKLTFTCSDGLHP